MKKIANNAISIYLVIVIFLIIKNFLPLAESIKEIISLSAFVLVVIMFFIERRYKSPS